MLAAPHRLCAAVSGGQPSLETPPLPDVPAIATDPSLRFSQLNRQITGAYVAMAPRFQAIVDPGFDGSSGVMPSWYGVAAYASRTTGGVLRAAEAALTVLERRGLRGGSLGLLSAAVAEHQPLARSAADLIDRSCPGMGQRAAAALVVAGYLAAGARPADLLDPRRLAVTSRRLVQLAASAPGEDLAARLRSVVRTALTAFEAGNRVIFADLGVAGYRYLEWRDRQGQPPSPEQVLSGFLPEGGDPQAASRLFHLAAERAASSEPLPVDLGRFFGFPADSSKGLLSAGFALYEAAGRAQDPAVRGRLVDMGNRLLTWREQAEIVEPVFNPREVAPGEVERARLFELFTPQVEVKVHGGTWRYDRFVRDHGEDRDGSPWTPRVTERTWSSFPDRWGGIVDFFDFLAGQPRSLWPMPDPDPARPLTQVPGRAQDPPPQVERGESGWLMS